MIVVDGSTFNYLNKPFFKHIIFIIQEKNNKNILLFIEINLS